MSSQVIGVIGLGLLGRGITTCLISRQFQTIVFDEHPEAENRARTHLTGALQELVKRNIADAELLQQWPDKLRFARSLEEFEKCDFVIESISENFDAKQKLFDRLENIVSPETPIASNTSSLSITSQQQARRQPQRFIGMHWAEPCHLTRFLEVIRGELTDDTTASRTIALGIELGKDPAVVQKDVEGFIVNRLGYAMYREAFWLLENGVADVETIDRAFCNAMSVWANLMGPFRWMDLTGLPAYASVMQRLFPQLSNATEVPQRMQQLVESGALGIVNGHGFYEYTPGDAELWEQRIHQNLSTPASVSPAQPFPPSEFKVTAQ